MIPPQFLTGIAKAAEGIVGGLMGGFDKLFTSKDEKLKAKAVLDEIQADLTKSVHEQLLEIAKLQQAEYEAMLKDTANAREQNIQIQNSDKASWLSKNVAYCIDIFVIIIWGFLTIYLIGNSLKIIKTSQVDLTGIYGLYAAVTGVAMTIINFHRGSSRGSEDKQKHLNEMMKK